jgi:uncharacterized membrane protein YeaQ/YmgE (transglycosylase-associated protein family)
VHTDYRNHAQSDDDPRRERKLRLGYTEDVVNAVLAVKSSPLPRPAPRILSVLPCASGANTRPERNTLRLAVPPRTLGAVQPEGVLSLLLVGLVVGGLGRLIVPGRQPVGCLLTVLIGIVGAAIGLYVGARIGSTWPVTLAAQVLAAALLVALFGGALRMRR